jgi:hypothetical protein
MSHDFYLSDDRKLAHIGSFTSEIGRLSQMNYIADAWDLGCGTGIYVQALIDAGIRCQGLDNCDLTKEKLHTDKANIVKADVSGEIWQNRNPRDLVVSIEVGEHIEADHAKFFAQNLCWLSRKWIFLTCSDLPGKYHVNPQPPSYWIELIESFGMHRYESRLSVPAMVRCSKAIPLDELRWFKYNLMIFRRRA